jgi:2-polyprenyl-3-methyl-5-hydroxy-6-metoxy-1,4-benzoquinol methylase
MKSDCGIPCDLCGSVHITVVSTLDRDRKHLRTVACQECGLLWSDPRPIDTRRFYEYDYRVQYKGTFNPKAKHVYRAGKVALDRYQRIRQRIVGRATLLDIGASAGEFLYLMAEAGFNAIGVEPNHGYRDYARSVYGLDVRPGAALHQDFPAASFDVVTFWHVLEHLDSPYANIQLAAKWLKPGGLLVIEVPNAEAICHAPINAFHAGHLYTFNRENLAMLGAKAGLRCEAVSLSPDHGNITALYVLKGDPPRDDCRIPGNFERVAGAIRNHTNLRHYMTGYPYSRLLHRLGRMLDETRSVRSFVSGRQCLDRLYAPIIGGLGEN